MFQTGEKDNKVKTEITQDSWKNKGEQERQWEKEIV